MDPVGPNVHGVSVGEAVLVDAAAYPVAAFEDGNLEAVLEEDVGAAKTSQTGAYYPNVGSLAGFLMYRLVLVSIVFIIIYLSKAFFPMVLFKKLYSS